MSRILGIVSDARPAAVSLTTGAVYARMERRFELAELRVLRWEPTDEIDITLRASNGLESEI